MIAKTSNKNLVNIICFSLATFALSLFLSSPVYAEVGNIYIDGTNLKVGEEKKVNIILTGNVGFAGGKISSKDNDCVTVSPSSFSKLDMSGKGLSSNSLGEVTIKSKNINCSTVLSVSDVTLSGMDGMSEDSNLSFVSGIIKVGSGSNDVKSDDSGLSSLYVSDGELTPSFNKDVHNYTVNVMNEVKSITLNGRTSSQKSFVNGNGTYSLNVGGNIINLSVQAEDGSISSYSINVNRSEYASIVGIDLNYYSKDVIIGDSFKLSITAMPSNAKAPTNIRYESSDNSVATVDNEGNVTAVSEGDATISVYVNKELMNSCKVSVHKYKKGDVNHDGRVNLRDVITALKMYFGTIKKDLASADINNDGKINLKDVIGILKIYFNN